MISKYLSNAWCLLFFFFSITFSNLSCTSPPNLKNLENAPKGFPLIVNKKSDTGFVLDDTGKLWAWSFEKNEQISVEEMMDDVYAFHFNTDDCLVVDNQGVLWTLNSKLGAFVLVKDIYKNDLNKLKEFGVKKEFEEHMISEMKKYDAPIVKAIPYKEGRIFLSADGKLDRAKSIMGKNKIDFSLFPPIKDFFATYNQVLAIDYNGDVWVAGKDRHLGSNTNHLFISEPIKVEGLSNIKRVGKELQHSMDSFYAIDKEDNIYYWGYNYYSSIPKKSELKGCSVMENRIITSNGQHIPFDLFNEKIEKKGKVNKEPLFSEGYGEWSTGKNYEYVLHLQKDGQLMRYTAIRDAGKKQGFSLTDPMPIGDFKVNLDYFKTTSL